MTKAMAVQLSGAYKRGQAVRKALKQAARKVGDVARGAGSAVQSGATAVRDFSRGVANK